MTFLITVCSTFLIRQSERRLARDVIYVRLTLCGVRTWRRVVFGNILNKYAKPINT